MPVRSDGLVAGHLVMQCVHQRVHAGKRRPRVLGDVEREVAQRLVRRGQHRVATKNLGRHAFGGAAHDAGEIIGFDQAADMDRDVGDGAIEREGVGDVAIGILAVAHAAVDGRLDAPGHHMLAVMIARRQAQDLRDVPGRFGIGVGDRMGDPDPHGDLRAFRRGA
jgi:hypothetical protein